MASPRICLTTARRFNRMAFQCAHLEAQDVLAECADVDLIALEPEPSFRWKQPWIRRLMYRDVSRKLAYANPGLKPVRLTGEYDLLVVMCQTYWDFLYVNAIEDWKSHCKTSVCWIDELWASNVPQYKYWMPTLSRFDHVVIGMHGAVAAASELIGQRCHCVPPAVDALRFSPYPFQPERVIDVYSIGRRYPAVHDALLTYSAATGGFYLYDTIQSGESRAPDHAQHRSLYANIAKRSRFFVVAPGKIDVPEETHGQVEVGSRYYEGAAAGAILVGQVPECEQYRTRFAWEDAVVPVKADGSDVGAVLRRLMSDPERMEEIMWRNASNSLVQHDWIHRWMRVFEIAGVQPSAGMQGRVNQLQALAEHAGRGACV